jgi:putative flippase GtrA
VGLASTATHFVVLSALYSLVGWPIVPATVVAFLCSLAVSYLLNRSFTFRSRVSHRHSAPRFLLVTLSGLCWNVAIMGLMVDVYAINYVVAFIVMSAVVAVNNFTLSRDWAFRASN